jgi:tetratricopeptide (TPR) repeat protein
MAIVDVKWPRSVTCGILLTKVKRRIVMRIILSVLVVTVGLSVPWNDLYAASAAWKQNTQLLPQYCKDRAKGSQSREFTKWRGTLGSVYTHAHHYCSGLYAEQKARITTDQRERKRFLGRVKGQMQYVSRHCSTNCSLYPELHTRWGWALGADGQLAEAIKHFQLAIQAKPDYAPAYAKLSDLYLESNQPDEARNTLNEGLKAKPGSRMLQRRLRELEAA